MIAETAGMASDSGADDAAALRERVAQLEETVAEQQATSESPERPTASRRGFVKAAAAAAGLGALGVYSSSPASAQAAGQVGTQSEPVDVEAYDLNVQNQLAGDLDAGGNSLTNVAAVETEQLNGVESFEQTDSAADINSSLSQSGVYVFRPGTHSVDDNLDITANDVSVIISSGATVEFPSSTSANALTDDQGSTHTFVFRSTGNNRVEIINRGTINPNNSNVAGADGILMRDGSDCEVIFEGRGKIDDTGDGLWVVDCDGFESNGVDVTNPFGSAIAAEGCTDSAFKNTRCVGGEAVDLNAYCDNCTVDYAVGVDSDEEVVDVNESPRTTVRDIEAKGNCAGVMTLTSDSGSRFTNETAPGNADECTFDGVKGTVSGIAIQVSGPNNYHDLTIRGADVESTGNKGMEVSLEGNNVADGLEVRGRIESSSGSHRGVDLGEFVENTGLTLDVTAISNGDRCLSAGDWSQVEGTIRAHGGATNGIVLASGGTRTAEDCELLVHARGSGAARDVWLTGDGTIDDYTIRGYIEQSITIDSLASDTRIDARYASLNDSGTNTTIAQYS
jgi:hypothetical protein